MQRYQLGATSKAAYSLRSAQDCRKADLVDLTTTLCDSRTVATLVVKFLDDTLQLIIVEV